MFHSRVTERDELLGKSSKYTINITSGQREQVFLGEEIGHQREYSDSTVRVIDQEVTHILQKAFAKALDTISEHRDLLDRLAKELMKREEVSGSEIMEWVKASRKKPARAEE